MPTWFTADGRREQTGARIVKLCPSEPIACPTSPSCLLLLRRASRLLAIGQMSNVTGGCPTGDGNPPHDAGMGGDG